MDGTITDEFMHGMLATTKNYCVMILREGPNGNHPEREKIVWEHGRRNFQMRAEGALSIVCPVVDGSDVKGLCIFNVSEEETRRIMEEDPGVQAGIFTYETHLCRSFPGDCLGK